MTRSWNYTMFDSSIIKQSRFQLHQDLKMRAQSPESAKDSPVIPPSGKGCSSHNFHLPTGMGYSSSDSLDHHPMQSQPIL
ncbi:hypothetical protein OIU74_012336 [Salix koriyanagi]|uniref:Uncharacterized protein n=1 Tax=Salix koriyanagi TaxID=2511006 RepID=A0A9Q0Q6T6_9ROSI|nr:hypothetical protein OIU74_012336 [Salix koriyanagi]